MAKTCWVDKWYQFRDANGILVSGTITTFTTGTDTPLAHYTNASGSGSTTSTTIPPNGRVAIWLDENVGYRIKIRNSSGTLIKQYDNVYGRMNVDLDGTIVDDSISLSAFAAQSAGRLLGTNGSGAAVAASTSAEFVISDNYLALAGQEERLIHSPTMNATTPGVSSTLTLGPTYISPYHKQIKLFFASPSNSGTWQLNFSSDEGATFRQSAGDYQFCLSLLKERISGFADSAAVYAFKSANTHAPLIYDATGTTGGTAWVTDSAGWGNGGTSHLTVHIWDHESATKKTKFLVVNDGASGQKNGTIFVGGSYRCWGYLNHAEITNAIKLTYNTRTFSFKKMYGIGNNG